MELDLAFIWAAIIAVAILAYVVLDGFDLGVGILFPLFDAGGERDHAMNSVAPVWDGNETWLIMGGGGLFAVFPLVYATVLPALYMPLIIMLIALVFRGVAFEYRWKTGRWKKFWDYSFFGGSLVATFSQGIALGALVQGIDIDLASRSYAGGWWDWLTPFSVATGVALLVGYALLGATWLVLKTAGAVRDKAHGFCWVLLVALLVLIGLVSLWTPFINPLYFSRWFAFPTAIFSVVVPVLLLGAAYLVYRGLAEGRDHLPFIGAQGIFLLCYAGIGISFYPYIVPGSLTIWDSAAPEASMLFLLVGASVLIPIILAYTIYAYWVFRGKLTAEEGYH